MLYWQFLLNLDVIQVVKYDQKRKKNRYTYIHILYLAVQKINTLRTFDHLNI